MHLGSLFQSAQFQGERLVDDLLDDDRGALTGPILAEVLLGLRRDEHADWVASVLRGLRWVDAAWDDWRSAARMGRDLAARGHSLPLSDLAIAAVALSRDLALFSTDPHFDLIPKLRKYP